jgi:putative transposase
MRKVAISLGEYYHIYNRGNNKQEIFEDDLDRSRLLFSLLGLQSDVALKNMSRLVARFARGGAVGFDEETTREIVLKRYVDVINFSLMPNHFHLILYERQAGGIARYMQRTLNSYTKYFNTRHQKHGHLFGGSYGAIHIENNEQLLHASAYVHRNCHTLPKWTGRSVEYPWSTYQDFAGQNRWGELVVREPILEQFSAGAEYYEWVETSGAKAQEWEFYLPDTVQH